MSITVATDGPGDIGGSVALDPVERAIDALRAGLPVLVVDADDRENEGDIILAAVHATPHWVGWTIRHTSGVLCVPMEDDLADRLELPPMVARNEDPRLTAFTVSVDARTGIGTGISATDRARSIQLLADPAAGPEDFVRPGHLFPLRARPGGVIERPGHTEAAVDLCRAAGLPAVGVLSEIVGDDGEPLRGQALRDLADAHDLPLISIEDLVEWRVREEPPVVTPSDPLPGNSSRVRRAAPAALLPTRHGDWHVIAYRDGRTGEDHLALTMAKGGGSLPAAAPAGDQPPLVRVHSECMTGDTLGSLRCDCGPQLDASLTAIAADPAGGVLVYLRGQEGRGIGLAAKIAAYALQDDGLDTVDANTVQGLACDAREYGAAVAILRDLGVERLRLLTNNPGKVEALVAGGIDVTERVPVVAGVQPHSARYLTSKRDRMGHLLPQHLDSLGGGVPDALVGRTA